MKKSAGRYQYHMDHIPVYNETVIVDTVGGMIGRVFNKFTQKHDIGIQFYMTHDQNGIDHGKESYIFLIGQNDAFNIAKKLTKYATRNWINSIFERRK